jgi:hypothetical protein
MAAATLLDAQFGRGSSPAWVKGFALTAACCRWPTDIDAVHAAAAAAIDWSIFAQTARRHRVAGLVHNAVERAELQLPADIANDIASEARLIARQNLAYAHETARLQRLFDRVGVQIVFLKGTALSQAAYGTLTVKHGRDIDLLVSPAEVPIALDLLQADGYSLRDPAGALNPAQLKALVAHGDQAELARHDGRLRLELHWRLACNLHLVHGIEPFAAPAQLALPGLGTLNVLRPEDEFVYLCVHGAGHSWSRLKWLADLNARLAGLEAHQIAGLYEYAKARGAGLCAGQALLLCYRLFGRVLPVSLREALKSDRRVTRLAASAAQSMMGDDPGDASVSRAARTFRNLVRPFRLGRGPRFLAAQMCGLLVVPGDAVRLPLPRALAFLYPLLRVPLWAWRQVPRSRGERPLKAPQRR